MNKLITLLLFTLIMSSCEPSQNTNEQTTTSENKKIVIIGHFYPLLNPKYLNVLKQQVESIEGVGAIVMAGDMVSKSILPHYDMLEQYFTSHFKVPIYYIPGNHEMSNEYLFHNKGRQISKIGNQTFYHHNKKIILFSAHQANDRASKANLDCVNNEKLAAAITDQSQDFETSYLVLADMRCFKRKQWNKNIQPLIDEYIDYVIIGDNESTHYTYTWEEFNGVPYIYQGITHRGHGLSGDNTFVVIDGNQINLHHLKIDDALDPAYKTKKKFKKLK